MSITELSNPLTTSLDASTGEGIVRILRTSDAQIFAGYDVFPSFADNSVRISLERGVTAAASVLRHPKGIIVISGSGTSGRLAYMVSTMLNASVRSNTSREGAGPFYYCNSGGDSALLLPSELAEDNTSKGVSDLQDVIQRADAVGSPVMVIGVTCGMSAPYIAGQLDYTLRQIARADTSMADFTSCLVGFNPTSLARDIPIEMWSERTKDEPHTFRDVAQILEAGILQDAPESPRHVLVNPVVGPESLCGSTRMKGGSATKICLETMLCLALRQVHGESLGNTAPSLMTAESAITSYYEAYTSSYGATSSLGRAVEVCGESLRSGGKVYYLGCGVASMVGFIDASEMRPTFGAPASETRAFAAQGWHSIGNVEGDLSNMGPLYNIHFDNFREEIIPILEKNDIVVALHCPREEMNDSKEVDQLALDAASKSGCSCVCLSVSATDEKLENIISSSNNNSSNDNDNGNDDIDSFTVYVDLRCHVQHALLRGYDAYGGFMLKLALNVLSTGGQARAGRVLSNRMINVTPSNHKLFLRCTGLVSLLAGSDGMVENQARRCLLRAIYATNDDAKVDELLLLPVSDYIKAAGAAGSIQRSNKLLPVAILLASGKCDTVENARNILREYATVREALSS